MQDILIFMQHHIALSATAIGVLIALIVLEFIKIKQATKRLMVVDIRKTDEFAQGHIVGSISVPFSDLATSKKIEKYRTLPIILVCANGVESQKAAATLENLKFTNIQILNGGLREWQQASMPIVKD